MASPSPVPPYRRVVEVSACSNASKTSTCLSGGIPIPVSVTVTWSSTVSAVSPSASHPDDDRAPLRELERVPDQVQDDLPQAAGIADERVGRVPGDVDGELQPLLVRAERQRLQRAAQDRPDGEAGRVQLELARLDLREVEDVVDDVEERVGRRLHHLEILALLGVEVGVQQELRHPGDAVHGRPDLVAHVRDELALGPAGRFRGLLGRAELRGHPGVLQREGGLVGEGLRHADLVGLEAAVLRSADGQGADRLVPEHDRDGEHGV